MNKKLLIPLLSIFLDIFWFSFILPIVPFIISDFWWNSFSVWLIVSAAAIWMFIWGIIFWRLSDKYWRKKVLIFTILLNIFWYLTFSFSTNLKIFFIARFLCWLGWWWASVVQAYISDISNEKERIVNMWYVWATIGLWFTLWPIFWSLISWLSLTHMWFISALLLFLSLILVVFLLEEKKIVHHDMHLSLKNSSKNLLILYFTYFINILAFAWIQTIFWLFLNNEFWVTSKNVGYMFWYLWVISIFYQIFLIKYAYKKLWEKKMVAIWLLFMWLWLILVWLNKHFYNLYFILIIFSIWISNIGSALFALIIKYSHKKDIWKNLWLNNAFWSWADSIWPILSWVIYLYWHNLPFFFFWLILIVASIFFYRLLRIEKIN